MKATVKVFYKDAVFDPQGSTLGESLKRLGYNGIGDVRVGKIINLNIEASSPTEAKAQLNKMCDQLLANPVIETYQIELSE